MAFPKKLISFLIKFVIIVIIVIAVIAGGLFVYYIVTLENAELYVPDEFALYLKVDSIRDIYDAQGETVWQNVYYHVPKITLKSLNIQMALCQKTFD